MTLTLASRLAVAALAFTAVLSTWRATLAMPGLV
jgi:hypothetical protein